MSSAVLTPPLDRDRAAARARRTGRADARATPHRVLGPGPARRTGLAVLSLAALGALVLAGRALRGAGRDDPMPAGARRPVDAPEARALHAAAAALAASVLLDSAIEHERARFENPGMWTPLLAASAALAAGLSGARRDASAPGRARSGAWALAGAAGGAGLGFHAWNLHRQPGGLSWLNLYYAAPLGAPAALLLSGAVGGLAGRLAAPAAGTSRPRVAGVPAGRAACALVAGGLAGTVGEVALLHDRGAWHQPLMLLPVSLPPVAALLVARAAVSRPAPPSRPARAWLRLTAALGVAGTALHAVGVARAMGGWRNWRQNVPDGPPLPAPPAFSALAVAGLAALRLRARDGDDDKGAGDA